MFIKIIPDARNEEKIADIKHALETLKEDALEEYLGEKVCEGEEWFDAMYYAAKDSGNDTVLNHWEQYFKDCLIHDEKYNYAADCGNYDCSVI